MIYDYSEIIFEKWISLLWSSKYLEERFVKSVWQILSRISVIWIRRDYISRWFSWWFWNILSEYKQIVLLRDISLISWNSTSDWAISSVETLDHAARPTWDHDDKIPLHPPLNDKKSFVFHSFTWLSWKKEKVNEIQIEWYEDTSQDLKGHDESSTNPRSRLSVVFSCFYSGNKLRYPAYVWESEKENGSHDDVSLCLSALAMSARTNRIDRQTRASVMSIATVSRSICTTFETLCSYQSGLMNLIWYSCKSNMQDEILSVIFTEYTCDIFDVPSDALFGQLFFIVKYVNGWIKILLYRYVVYTGVTSPFFPVWVRRSWDRSCRFETFVAGTRMLIFFFFACPLLKLIWNSLLEENINFFKFRKYRFDR